MQAKEHPAFASHAVWREALHAPHRWLARRPQAVLVSVLALAVSWVAYQAISTVLGKVGHPAAALDDAYIHFQYARAIAEGHPLRFQAGLPRTSGSTSLLWPLALAPFWAAGLRGDSIMWAAWALSFAALGGLAWEISKLTHRLAGRAAAAGAAVMTLGFAGLVWCAASGMEVVPFAWAIARATRRASEWAEKDGGDVASREPGERGHGHAAELTALAWGCALLRPEGALTALFVAATLAVFGARGPRSTRLYAPVAALGAFATPLLFWMLTGSPRSTTATAKLLLGNPYYVGPVLDAAVLENVRTLLHKLLNGEVWSAEFLPHDGGLFAVAGLLSIAVLGARTRSTWRACGVLLLAVSIFAPCFYLTFLWNRLRYLWPFTSGWLVGLACLTRLVGDLGGALVARFRLVTGVLCGMLAGLFWSKVESTIDDVAQSASGIDRQQVALGLWAKGALPTGAIIGVNDTGAIAYFGEHQTFDIVGLTTRGEARYWVAGAGSRFEHYERLYATSPQSLPTHFIVYPEWMALDSILGAPQNEATVLDSTILGGRTMRAFEADWSKLGSGQDPWSTTRPVLDDVDVADLESEADHEYQLLDARDGDEVAHEGLSPEGRTVVDGGRTRRSLERFVLHLPVGGAATCILRAQAPAGTTARVIVASEAVGELSIATTDGEWSERSFELPARLARARVPVEVRLKDGLATTFHYWCVAAPP